MIYGAILINIIVWLVAIKAIVYSRKVIYECRIGMSWIILIMALVAGLVMYIRLPFVWGVGSFVSLLAAAGAVYLTKSGLGKDEVIILGRRYPYQKVRDIRIIKSENRTDIAVELKRKTVYLFADRDKGEEVKRMIKKLFR